MTVFISSVWSDRQIKYVDVRAERIVKMDEAVDFGCYCIKQGGCNSVRV